MIKSELGGGIVGESFARSSHTAAKALDATSAITTAKHNNLADMMLYGREAKTQKSF